ncbi:MAG: type IV secretory system conjugative DNA transfer family protein, partial [Acidobacteria bacterium]|nr:type IV secretory system conjugative DNA transfer family protein [Acidobacteriota bacterium]
TLLLSLIKADIENREDSVCVVDVHGDLINSVMENVPEDRLQDVMLFDPSDAEYPIGFNVLHANSPLEKTILSSDLVATFRRMATSWGDVMDTVLANGILAFLESTRGGTLADLRRFLVEPDFRRAFLETVTDEAVRYFWDHEFHLIAGKPQASILVRLDSLLRQALVRNVICQKDNQLDFRRLVNDKRIILIKLSHGLIGEENAYLLGTMILSRIYQAALSRQDSTKRPYCWTYVDEFHHLISPSLESVLSGSRKYNLGLTLAHQEFRQLQSRSQEVASSVLSNCYTRVCFRLGDNDAERFAGGFSSFDAKALQNLGIGEAIARIERADYDFNLSVDAVPPVARQVAKARVDAIRESSRRTYGRPRSEVEDELRTTRTNAMSVDKKSAAKPRREAEVIARSNYDLRMQPGREEPSNVAMEVAGEHAYLQSIIKRIGERYGYRATIEQPVLGGVGKVDVALENDTSRIAVEIANTNTTGYEVQNIQKCLAAQFDRVMVVSTDTSHLKEIRTMAQATLSDAQLLKTSFVEPANIHLFLERLQQQDHGRPISPKVKGYRVDTTYADVSETDAELIAQNLADLLGQRGEK